MAKVKISEFSANPANNTDIDGINIAENCPPSGINDAIRELMAQLKDFQAGTAGDSFNGPIGTTTAAAGAFTTLSASGAVTLSGGTANGVAYLNGSKVLTSGSALTFDGTRLTSTVGKFGSGAAANSASLMVNNVTNTATGIQLFQDGIESWIMGMPANSAGLAWSASGSEQMRLTSTGLGIGTSSPAYKLDVNGQARVNNLLWFTPSSGLMAIGASGTNFQIYNGTGAETRLTLDSSGNLGLGVTPSAWSSYKAIQVGQVGAMWANPSGTDVYWSANYYFGSGSDRYIANGLASYYRQSAGVHSWGIAPSGTAGNAISFTQAMTLDASGNLLVGTTSNAGFGGSVFQISTSNANPLLVRHAGSTASDVYGQFIQFSNSAPNSATNYFLQVQDNVALRAQIRSNGGIANYQANDVNLSDRREKVNFAPAKSYLETICAIPVQTFNYIDQNMEKDGGLTLGVVAQDVQAVAPELVMESNWGTEDEPKMRLSIYQTDLQYALMKAIQEQQAIIEDMKTRLAAAGI